MHENQVVNTKSPYEELQGIINVYKPVGISSFFVVSKMRQLTGIKKIGHCGTLDPFAEGCLPICLGRATAAVRFMDAYDKTYRAEICLGLATDSEDCTGEVMQEDVISLAKYQEWRDNDSALIRRELRRLEGEQEQIPPMHSAIKVNGQPLYKLARQGKAIERKARKIKVYKANLVDLAWRENRPFLTVDFHVSKGTYVRTLGVQLARQLGTVGHLTRLLRTSCGPFTTESAVHLETIAESRQAVLEAKEAAFKLNLPFISAGNYRTALLPTDRALQDLPALSLSYAEGKAVLQGKKLPLTSDFGCENDLSLAAEGRWRLYGEGRFIGIGVLQKTEDEQFLKAERMFIHIDHY